MSESAFPSQWIEISKQALLSNIALFREILPLDNRLTAVVKANAYGHGLREVISCVAPAVDCFAVHSISEARVARETAPERPVLIMGYLGPGECRAIGEGMEILLSGREVLSELARSGVKQPLHLKIDTGTHRQGISLEEIPGFIEEIRKTGLNLIGVGTHFANIEDTLEHEFAREQLGCFKRALEIFRESGVEPRWIHTACSAAALLFPETHFNMARIGISMYGHWSSRETQLSWKMQHARGSINLEPALSWKTLVGQLQEVKAGETVGYGRSWRASRPTLLAVLPVGYSDGYPRALGNRGRVLIRGHYAPIVGRVCMNIMMVDVSDLPEVKVGDEVVLIGRSGGECLKVEELAEGAGTINYELLSRISAHIERRLV